MNTFLISVLAFLFAIGVLVAIHEWGHYIVARLVGVKVLRFSIGFGKPLWLIRSGPDQTEYCISAIPLGGYVKLLDEREDDVSASELPRAFNQQSFTARTAILAAGPLMNFVFAIVAFWAMFIAGIPGMQPIVGDIDEGSIAAKGGLISGDLILSISGQNIATWEGGVLAIIDAMLAENEIALIVQNENGLERQLLLDVSGKVNELTEPGALFTGLGLRPWSPILAPVMGEIAQGGTAERSGLQTGDEILQAEGQAIADWTAWVEFIRERPNETVATVILRDSNEVNVELIIGDAELEDGSLIGRIGAGPLVPEGFFELYLAEQKYGPFDAVNQAIDRTWSMTVLTVRMVISMVSGDVSVKNISGPINIAQYAGSSASMGPSAFLNFLAVVSLSLGILNLLPIPVLDGGQIVYQLAELLKGGPLSERAQLVGQQIGIAFLMLIMGFAFYNDLTRVFS
jgi:regulator of sigma E protease